MCRNIVFIVHELPVYFIYKYTKYLFFELNEVKKMNNLYKSVIK